MRTQRHRYTEWRNLESDEVEAVELYDHEADADENANVAGQPENADTVRRLAAMSKRGWREALPRN